MDSRVDPRENLARARTMVRVRETNASSNASSNASPRDRSRVAVDGAALRERVDAMETAADEGMAACEAIRAALASDEDRVAFDDAGNLYVMDSLNNRIVMVAR